MRDGDFTHVSRGVDCFPAGDCAFTVRLRARRGACTGVTLVYTLNKFDWWKALLRVQMPRVFFDSAFDYYAVTVRGNDSRLAYIFELDNKGKNCFFSEQGVSEAYDHSLSYYTYFQYPFSYACDRLTPIPWVGGAVTYQIFPERFFNGTGSKPYIDTDWDDVPKPKSFFGGDLAGIREKLPYLSDLGVSCLYLTPIFPSKSNHKYDVIDYFDVDEGFGGKEAFRALVDAAHARHIRVLLDGVFNHCSSQNALFLDVKRQGRASKYYDWFFVDGDRPDEEKKNYLTFGEVSYMPKMNLGNPETIRYFCGVAAYWIKEFDIDGWRLDVCDETSDAFLRALRAAVKAEKKDAVIIGEIWHESAHWLQGDMLDGVMNYGLTKACLDFLAFESIDAKTFRDRLCRLLWRSTDTANGLMMNLMGSHDTDRFLTRVKGSAERLKMAYACAFFFPGMPSVYYGDEVGMQGGYDPLCRGGFPWDEKRWNGDIRDFIKALAHLKGTSEALKAGETRVLLERGMPVIERAAQSETARLYLNLSSAAKTARWQGQTKRVKADGLQIFVSGRQ